MALPIIALLAVLFAQPKAERPIDLTVTDTIVFNNEFTRPLLLPVKCDGDGNVYIRNYQGSLYSAPVIRLSPEKKTSLSFSVGNLAEFSGAGASDFSVTPEGDVYEIVMTGRDDLYLVHFAKDGTYTSKTRLSPTVEPYQVAVFNDGSSLVSGFDWDPPDAKGSPTAPFTGIFDHSGRLVKRFNLKEDALVGEKNKSRDGDPPATVSLASVAMGSDNYAYYLRRTESPTIYVLSSEGQTVRTIKIDSPEKGFQPQTIKVAGGRIAVEFVRDDGKNNRDEVLLEVVDAQTGLLLRTYRTSPEIGSAFACFAPEDFTFITAKGGKLTLTKAH